MQHSWCATQSNTADSSVYPYRRSNAWESLRNILLSPKKHLKRLPLQKNFRVLEVGCGAGFYSVEVARFLTYGILTLIDDQENMLATAKSKMEKAQLDNVHYINADAVRLPLTDGSVDMIYLVTVFGELYAQQTFLKEAWRVLKADGFLSISEHRPASAFMPMDVVESFVIQEGFDLPEMYGWQWNYTLNFKKITA